MPETPSETPTESRALRYRLTRMSGRDPGERHRAATPLELLFDLAFVVAFGQAADQLAHFIAEDHLAQGLLGFTIAIFGTCWAWINFSWFASAYDTDDWFYRVTTMVQMIGVIIWALGQPVMFASLLTGDHVENGVAVAGYVVMRLALVVQWLRAARQDPARRRTALAYATCVGVAQVGWIVLAIVNTSTVQFLIGALFLFVVELSGPIIAESRSSGTPWHPHHIAERYGLLAIIALGEGVFGTVAAVSVLVQEHDWSTEAVLVVVAGIGLTFGLWWTYFIIPSGRVLARRRRLAWVWGYGHIFIYGSIAATGAGLHVAAFVVGGETHIGVPEAIVAVAVPVGIFSIALFALYSYLVKEFDPFHVLLFAGTVLMLAAAILLAQAGASIGVCLIIITLSPAVVVVGYEVLGHKHQAAVLARIESES